jgi:hypothetical protein
MTRWLFGCILLCGALLIGCASSGSNVDDSSVSNPSAGTETTQGGGDESMSGIETTREGQSEYDRREDTSPSERVPPGSRTPDGQMVYAHGYVLAPDSSGVADAEVITDPLVTATRTDESGYFRVFQPLPGDEYTFMGRMPGNRNVQGETTISTSGEIIEGTIRIILGREMSLDAVDLDSTRAAPSGGPGRKRTGGDH